MALPVRKFREVVLQLLYSLDIDEGEPEELEVLLAAELGIAQSDVRRARDRVSHIVSLLHELDAQIEEVSKEYALDRIQRIERNVLRLGVYEMLHDPEVPSKVAIAEAVRLTRKFSTPEASLFVNALLDAVLKGSVHEGE